MVTTLAQGRETRQGREAVLEKAEAFAQQFLVKDAPMPVPRHINASPPLLQVQAKAKLKQGLVDAVHRARATNILEKIQVRP
jgi:hypothetical protein